MKKHISLLLTALLVLSMMTFMSVSASAAWDGSISVDFAGGNGTEASPFEIASAQDLALVAKKVNEEGIEFEGQYLRLTADIDLGGTPWVAIGNRAGGSIAVFKGTFDGDGHTVSGLNIDDVNTDTGLFGRVSGATIKNLTVTGDKVAGAKYAGAIAGYAINGSTILNCHSAVKVVQGTTAGGIVGRVQAAGADGNFNVIKGCTSGSEIVLLASKDGFGGGIVGAAGATEISWCINTGNVKSEVGSTNLLTAGGIIGVQGASSMTSHVRNCYSTGDVTLLSATDATYAGGIIGRAAHITAETFLENCFSTGHAIVKDENGVAVDGKYGSLIGHIRYVLFVSNCYTSSPVSECPEVGSDPNACIENGNITIITEAQMKGKDAVANMKLGSGWVADAAGFPTIDLSAAKDPETPPEPEVTTPDPSVTTAPAPTTTTPAPEVTTPEPEVTTPTPTGTTATPSDTTPGGNTPSDPEKSGPNVFVILIIVVVVLAAGAIVVVVVMDKKKKK